MKTAIQREKGSTYLSAEKFRLLCFEKDGRYTACSGHRGQEKVPQLSNEDSSILAAEEGRQVDLDVFGVRELDWRKEREKVEMKICPHKN